ncbi:helix-turn-helix domain-containing protein [Spirosoma harenae]
MSEITLTIFIFFAQPLIAFHDQLLRAGHSITDTVYLVGFDSPAYFTKCFREVYQQTPGKFAAQRL